MVQSTAILSLVLLPSLALAGSSFHQRRHAHHKHQQQQRAVGVHTVVTTQFNYVATTTVTYGNIPSDEPAAVPDIKADAMGDVNAEAWGGKNHGKSRSSTPAAVPTSSAAAVSPQPAPSKGTGEEPAKSSAAKSSSSKAAPAKSSSAVVVPEPSATAPESSSTPTPSKTPYTPPSGGGGGSGTPGKVTIQNNCAYDLYLKMEISPVAGCPSSHESWTKISAGKPWSGPIIGCNTANPSYKVSPKPDGSGPIVQYETGYKPLTSEMWEDISLINCVTEGSLNGEGIENCVGAPWYLEATNPKSTAACQQLGCSDADSCCSNTLGAYCSPVADAQKLLGGLEPTGMCNGPMDEITVFGSFC